MSALKELLRGTTPEVENRERHPANPANPANRGTEISNISSFSRGAFSKTHFAEDVSGGSTESEAGIEVDEARGEKIAFRDSTPANSANPANPATLSAAARRAARRRSAAIKQRRAEVMEMMRQSPGRVAYRAFDDGHADGITLAIGIPAIGTAELTIPRDRYDPAALMALFETTHGPAVEPEHVADSGHSLGTAETIGE